MIVRNDADARPRLGHDRARHRLLEQTRELAERLVLAQLAHDHLFHLFLFHARSFVLESHVDFAQHVALALVDEPNERCQEALIRYNLNKITTVLF